MTTPKQAREAAEMYRATGMPVSVTLVFSLADQIEKLTKERDALAAAGKLALEALAQTILVPCYGGHPRQEAAYAALREAGVQ